MDSILEIFNSVFHIIEDDPQTEITVRQEYSMNEVELEGLRFPIGRFTPTNELTENELKKCFSDLETFPEELRLETTSLTSDQLDTAYRPDGWTIRQVVHHCADSHLNSFMRFKLALTEYYPIIKPYFEDKWAELADSTHQPIEPSLQIIQGIHKRWVFLLRSMKQTDFQKGFNHPEQNRVITLLEATAMYAWHSNHHLAHITQLKKRNNW